MRHPRSADSGSGGRANISRRGSEFHKASVAPTLCGHRAESGREGTSKDSAQKSNYPAQRSESSKASVSPTLLGHRAKSHAEILIPKASLVPTLYGVCAECDLICLRGRNPLSMQIDTSSTERAGHPLCTTSGSKRAREKKLFLVDDSELRGMPAAD